MSERAARILIVDDHLTNRLKMAMLVKRLGYESALAENGREALELLRNDAFDLVLLDIIMPEMDGYQVLELIKQDKILCDIPVIVISTLQEMDSVITCIELGAEDHLARDFDPVLFKARISACLEKKRLRDATMRQLNFIREIFGKYVPESVAETLVENKGKLEPERTDATILFSDIDNFTGISETLPPEQVFRMLNEYYPAVIEQITRHNGVVNQFQGDAVLATFNVPLADPEHADNAVQAALAIQHVTENRNFAGFKLSTRVGINSGEIIAGNIGSGERFSYTVLGDSVNLASRLEQLNKTYNSSVLISGDTVNRLKKSYPFEALGEVNVRGKQKSVHIVKVRAAKNVS